MRNWIILLVASVTVFGCGSSQVDEFFQNNPGVNPTSLVISPKPVTKLIGQTQQFVATGSFSNGTTADVTGLVQWSSSNPAVVTISATTGLATALLPGQVTITAQSSGFSDTATMTVTGGITRVSVDSAGVQGNSKSETASISADGRFVAFQSRATNLVALDGNSTDDIFVHDRQTGSTTRVSVNSTGVEGNGSSFQPSISGDGRFVAFASAASNLVADDSNGQTDIFVYDRQSSTITRISVGSTGGQGNGNSFQPSISGDGRFVAFESDSTLVTGDTNGARDIFVHERQTGTTTLISVDSNGGQGNDSSGAPSISADGRLVAFDSTATNLVVGDSNLQKDIFVHDRQTHATTRVSVSSAGAQGLQFSQRPSISADGRFVAFESFANSLVNGDTNSATDIFVHDLQTGSTTRESLNSAGIQGDSFNNRPSISADGRFVAFESGSTNLVTGDSNGSPDVFIRDRQAGTTSRASLSAAGVQGDATSYEASISADGLFVAFTSRASNLVTGDSNAIEDVFVTNR